MISTNLIHNVHDKSFARIWYYEISPKKYGMFCELCGVLKNRSNVIVVKKKMKRIVKIKCENKNKSESN